MNGARGAVHRIRLVVQLEASVPRCRHVARWTALHMDIASWQAESVRNSENGLQDLSDRVLMLKRRPTGRRAEPQGCRTDLGDAARHRSKSPGLRLCEPFRRFRSAAASRY